MSLLNRLQQEYETVSTMIKIYCKENHYPENGVCDVCLNLKKYCYEKLQKCRFQDNKPTCGSCPVHCYRKSMQKKIREVMKYSGPKMIYKHPLMAIKHLMNGRKKVELNLLKSYN